MWAHKEEPGPTFRKSKCHMEQSCISSSSQNKCASPQQSKAGTSVPGSQGGGLQTLLLFIFCVHISQEEQEHRAGPAGAPAPLSGNSPLLSLTRGDLGVPSTETPLTWLRCPESDEAILLPFALFYMFFVYGLS